MKKIFVLTLLVYLSSCSTSSKNESNDANIEAVNKPAIASSAKIETTENKKKIETIERPDVKTSKSASESLSEAIKAQSDDAIQKMSSEILTQNPQDVKALNALAMVYYKKGRFDASLYLLNKAATVNANSSEVYNNIGLVQLAQNDRRDAVKSFRKALEVNSQDSFAAANLGAIYIQEKDYNKALLALDIATKSGTKDIKILNNFAIASAANGKTIQAVGIYERLLKENPSQKEVMLNYAILMIEDLQKYRDGLDLLNRLKFVGAPVESRQIIKDLEIKAKAGLK